MKIHDNRVLQTSISVLFATGLLRCSSDESVSPDGPHDAAAVIDAGQEGDAGESGHPAVGALDASVSDTGMADAVGAKVDAGDATDAMADAPAPLYHPCPPAGTPCKIMPTGDSITAGYDSTTGGGYRLRLLHDIWTANHEASFVGDSSSGPDALDGKAFPKENEGHSGYTIDDAPAVQRSGISPLVPPALLKYTPHIVTLMIGTNDVGTQNDLPNAPVRLAKLIDAIIANSPKALLIVAQITPTGDDAMNIRIQAYNAAIPGIVKTRAAAGKHILMVDMYSAFTANPSYRTQWMNGSLHPNDAGYDVMGGVWYSALAPYL